MNEQKRLEQLAEARKGTMFTSNRQPSAEMKSLGWKKKSIADTIKEDILTELTKDIKMKDGSIETFVNILSSKIKKITLPEDEEQITEDNARLNSIRFKRKQKKVELLVDIIDRFASKFAAIKVSGSLDINKQKEMTLEELEAEHKRLQDLYKKAEGITSNDKKSVENNSDINGVTLPDGEIKNLEKINNKSQDE